MKAMVGMVILAIGLLSGLALSRKGGVVNKNAKGFVVLELFTSEGCSSCPPADRLLPELAKIDSSLIPLSFHVDYWNTSAWKDSFSSAAFSSRQQAYGSHFHLESIYTPQLIVNGEYELVGSDRSLAEGAIHRSLNEANLVNINIDSVALKGGNLRVHCVLRGKFDQCVLCVAIVEKEATTSVKGGENAGATISHTNVVRSFNQLAATGEVVTTMPFPPGIKPGNWRLVVYTQRRSDLKIIGAASYTP